MRKWENLMFLWVKMWSPWGVQKRQKMVIEQNPYPNLGVVRKSTFRRSEEIPNFDTFWEISEKQ